MTITRLHVVTARGASVLALLGLLSVAPPAAADAIVRTTAMLADNIVEIFITDGEMRLELCVMCITPQKLNGIASHRHRIYSLNIRRYFASIQPRRSAPLVNTLSTGTAKAQEAR